MVAIQYDTEARAVHLIWGCTAPHYNIWKYGKQEYRGVGGHLIAIAAELSEKHGYDGFLYGDASFFKKSSCIKTYVFPAVLWSKYLHGQKQDQKTAASHHPSAEEAFHHLHAR